MENLTETVEAFEDALISKWEKDSALLNNRDPEELPWKELGVDSCN